MPSDHHRRTGAGNFVSTHWSVIGAFAHEDASSEAAQAALRQFCVDYWPPLYAYARRRGSSPHDAQDLTQGFFAYFLENKGHTQADPNRGKFRSFLLGAFKNFMANDWNKQHRIKRGGGAQFTSLHVVEEEELYLKGAADFLTPEKLFDRRWAQGMIARVLARLRQEYEATDQLPRFEAGKEWLLGSQGEHAYAKAAATLGMAETGVRTLVSRLRRRFRELMRSEIAGTVSDPAEVDEELRSLYEALQG